MILGLGHPLLDVSATVGSDFLDKYKLSENSAQTATDETIPIFNELEKNYKIEYTAGGSTQNTLRCARWILQQPNVVTFIGCIGNDRYAEILEEKVKADGLNVIYQYNDLYPTGRCAVLVTGKHRTLVAHSSAAKHFTLDHLEKRENWAYVEKANIFYISGFFFGVCTPAIEKIADYAYQNDKTFIMNLSAPYVCKNHKTKLLEILPYVNIVFGNSDETAAYEKYVLGSETNDVHYIAKTIANSTNLTKTQRVVIITQGDNSVLMAKGNIIKEFPVAKVLDEKIVDTNGAGDSFVGGFLAQYAKNEPLEKCIECGIWVSSVVIQQCGCTFPEKMIYN